DRVWCPRVGVFLGPPRALSSARFVSALSWARGLRPHVVTPGGGLTWPPADAFGGAACFRSLLGTWTSTACGDPRWGSFLAPRSLFVPALLLRPLASLARPARRTLRLDRSVGPPSRGPSSPLILGTKTQTDVAQYV